MLGIRLAINSKAICNATINKVGLLTSMLIGMGPNNKINYFLDGSTTSPQELNINELHHWVNQELSIGDELEIMIIDIVEGDPPLFKEEDNDEYKIKKDKIISEAYNRNLLNKQLHSSQTDSNNHCISFEIQINEKIVGASRVTNDDIFSALITIIVNSQYYNGAANLIISHSTKFEEKVLIDICLRVKDSVLIKIRK